MSNEIKLVGASVRTFYVFEGWADSISSELCQVSMLVTVITCVKMLSAINKGFKLEKM
jgi:hypothetical protein